MSIVTNNTVLVRRLDVTARITDQVADITDRPEGGVLLETLIGRYVLDRDARVVWLLIDGRRKVREIVDGVAVQVGLRSDEVWEQVFDLCSKMVERRLVEILPSAETAQPAATA
jgi:hypothetical protein